MSKTGYKNPRFENRFNPGQSGNPTGRPKKPPTMASGASAALQELTQLAGRRMTLQRALVQKLAEDAVAAESKDLLAALRFSRNCSKRMKPLMLIRAL